MKKSNKIVIGVIVAVLIVSVAVLGWKSAYFSGTSELSKEPTMMDTLSVPRLFRLKNRIVSAVTTPVTSAVPSVVVSRSTTSGGTSKVASVVTSPVASPVATPVAVDDKTASKTSTKKLKTLTQSILRSIEKEYYKNNLGLFLKKAEQDYKKNPGMFTLSQREKQKLIDLYIKNNPMEFIFERAK